MNLCGSHSCISRINIDIVKRMNIVKGGLGQWSTRLPPLDTRYLALVLYELYRNTFSSILFVLTWVEELATRDPVPTMGDCE